MKSCRHLLSAASLVLFIALVVGAVPPAQAGTSETARLNGVIVDVDRDARTITVRSAGDARLTTVRVPEGRSLRLSRTGNFTSAPAAVRFEHAQRGLHVSLSVKSTDTLAVAK
jgi:hypothetical protein